VVHFITEPTMAAVAGVCFVTEGTMAVSAVVHFVPQATPAVTAALLFIIEPEYSQPENGCAEGKQRSPSEESPLSPPENECFFRKRGQLAAGLLHSPERSLKIWYNTNK
jgi:hypothetical protein